MKMKNALRPFSTQAPPRPAQLRKFSKIAIFLALIGVALSANSVRASIQLLSPATLTTKIDYQGETQTYTGDTSQPHDFEKFSSQFVGLGTGGPVNSVGAVTTTITNSFYLLGHQPVDSVQADERYQFEVVPKNPAQDPYSSVKATVGVFGEATITPNPAIDYNKESFGNGFTQPVDLSASVAYEINGDVLVDPSLTPASAGAVSYDWNNPNVPDVLDSKFHLSDIEITLTPGVAYTADLLSSVNLKYEFFGTPPLPEGAIPLQTFEVGRAYVDPTYSLEAPYSQYYDIVFSSFPETTAVPEVGTLPVILLACGIAVAFQIGCRRVLVGRFSSPNS